MRLISREVLSLEGKERHLLPYTHIDDSRWSKAFICVCDVSVCLSARTKTAETTITKLATDHYESSLFI